MVVKKIIDDEFLFLDMRSDAGATAAHLLVENWAHHPAAHNDVQDLPAIKSGIQHADTNSHHWIGLPFKLTDQGIGIDHIRGDDHGVITLMLRMKFIEVMGEAGGMALGDGKNHRLTWTNLLTRGQFLV